MATKRLYECDYCHAKRFVYNRELDRAGKPRCTGCGSTRLELVSAEGVQEMQERQVQRVIGTGGSLKLAKDADKPNRKVT